MNECDIKKYLPISLDYPLWNDLAESLSEELCLLYEEINKDANYWNIELQEDNQNLLYISEMFGKIPNIQIDQTLDFLKKEVNLISYYQSIRGSKTFYDVIFNVINRTGNIFLVQWTGKKLIRMVDTDKFIADFSTHDLSKPFLLTDTLYSFPESFFAENRLDSGLILDTNFTLDSEFEKIITEHLGVNYTADRLYTVDSTEFIIIPDYLDYLLDAVLYNKKATEIPHIGLEITATADNSGSYNSISGGDYSIEAIKLNTSVTLGYINLYKSAPFYLDVGRNLDSVIPTYLDNEDFPPFSPDISIFKSVEAGIGKRNLINSDNISIYNDISGYWSFDDTIAVSTDFKDYSVNNNAGQLFGNYTPVLEGIFGKSVLFSGDINSYGSISSFNISNDNFNFSFWVQPLGFNTTQTLVDIYNNILGYNIKFEYNNTTNQISLTLFNLVNSYSLTMTENTNYFFSIQVDRTNDSVKFKIDNSLIDTIDISTVVNYSGSYDIFLAGDKDTIDNTNCLLDELKFYNRLLSDNEVSYIYNNQISNSNALAKKIYESDLELLEVFEAPNFFLISTYVEANTVSGETIYISDGIQQSSSFTTEFDLIKRNTVEIFYTDSGNFSDSVFDDGFGNFIGDNLTGTIDYLTGQGNINYFVDSTIENLLIGHSTAYTVLNFNVPPEILPSTLEITYFVGGTQYTATDDGLGNITGTAISSATINYVTGIGVINFSSPTDPLDILANYTKRVYTIPENNTEIKIRYGTDNNLDITEVGLKNEDNDLLVYAEFPPARFSSNQNHLAVNFILFK